MYCRYFITQQVLDSHPEVPPPDGIVPEIRGQIQAAFQQDRNNAENILRYHALLFDQAQQHVQKERRLPEKSGDIQQIYFQGERVERHESTPPQQPPSKSILELLHAAAGEEQRLHDIQLQDPSHHDNRNVFSTPLRQIKHQGTIVL